MPNQIYQSIRCKGISSLPLEFELYGRCPTTESRRNACTAETQVASDKDDLGKLLQNLLEEQREDCNISSYSSLYHSSISKKHSLTKG